MDLDKADLEKLELVYLQKLEAYTSQKKSYDEELNKYINQENTSAKNNKHIGQNVFVNKLDSSAETTSLGCHNVHTTEWTHVDMSSNKHTATNCKNHALLNNNKYFGLKSIGDMIECYVGKSPNLSKSGKGYPKLYWQAPDIWKDFYKTINKTDPPANVATLGFDELFYLLSYDSSKKWLSQEGIETAHFTSNNSTNSKLKDCNLIYGGNISNINALYGNNCKESEWNSNIGQVHASKVISDKFLNTSGGNILINDDLLGDPCKGKKKDIVIQYKCGNQPFKTKKGVENDHIDINCDDLIKNCPSFYGDTKNLPPLLKILDTGDICIYKSQQDKSPVWCLSNDASGVKQILGAKKVKGSYKSGLASDSGIKISNRDFNIGGDKYSNTNWLKNRDYINAGEPFQKGMLLASKNGSSCMVLDDDGNLQLYYASMDCDNSNDGKTNRLNVSEFKVNNVSNLNNLGKMGYVVGYGQDKGVIKQYTDDLINYSSNFSSPVKNTTFDYESSQSTTDISLKDCKDRCVKMGDGKGCIGVTWKPNRHEDGDTGTCYYSNAKNYNKLFSNTKYDDKEDYMYRIPKISNNNSCNKQINNINNTSWYNYDIDKLLSGDMMDMDDTCGLALATGHSRDNLKKTYSELKDVVDAISKKFSEISQTKQNEMQSHGINIDKLKASMKQFADINENTDRAKDNYDSYKAILKDSEFKLYSNDNKYVVWSLLAVTIILIAIILSK